MERKKLTRKEKFQNVPASVKNAPLASSSGTWLPGLIIAILGFLIYSNTLNHNFTLDDYSVILENRITKQGFSAIPEIFKTSYRSGYYFTDDNLYRPVVKAMFAAEWGISPGSAKAGHWMNVLLYSFTGFILFQALLRLTSGKVLFAFIASALFIAHPIHTEVVANIKSRDEIMAFLFCIWSLERFVSWLRNKQKTEIMFAIIFYAIALMSKESAITFLAIFPLAGWFFTSSTPLELAKKTIPLIAVAVVFLLIRSAVLSGNVPGTVSIADNLLIGAKDPVTRITTAVVILGMYLKLLIFPHPLVFDYSFNQIPLSSAGDFKFLVSALCYIAMLVFAIWKLKARNYFSFFILFFLVTLSISSNIFITIGSSMGERFLYIPSLGFCMALAWGMILLTSKFSTIREGTVFRQLVGNKAVAAILLIVLIGYSFKTVSRNPDWKDNYSLYSNDVHLSPNSTRTHYYLGNYLVKPEAWEGKDENAKRETLYRGISELKKSIAIFPGFSDAHVQMGVAYYKLNNGDSALISYQKALQLNPNNAPTHNNIGTIYFSRQQYTEALRFFLKAVDLDPKYAEAHGNAGSAYGMMQQYDNALSSLFQSIKYDPNFAMGYYFIGLTYRFKGDETNANSYLEKAYNLDPALRPVK